MVVGKNYKHEETFGCDTYVYYLMVGFYELTHTLIHIYICIYKLHILDMQFIICQFYLNLLNKG